MEEWKPVVGYEGLYEVSNFGLVRSLDRFYTTKHPRSLSGDHTLTRIHKGKILSQINHNKGYLTVVLSKNGKTKSFLVHTLVAKAFIDSNLDRKYSVVDHINEDKKDNRVNNLQIISNRQNLARSGNRKAGKHTGVYYLGEGVKNPWEVRLTFEGKTKYLGKFSTDIEAATKYFEFLRETDPLTVSKNCVEVSK